MKKIEILSFSIESSWRLGSNKPTANGLYDDSNKYHMIKGENNYESLQTFKRGN